MPAKDPAKKRPHITASELRDAMSHTWNAPKHALLWEVGDATGGRHTRRADAIIMGLWPMVGLHLHGIEIKTHRSDWLREIKDPSKSEPVARFCDFWWVHATPGVVKVEELGVGWGLRVFDGTRWKTEVKATLREAEPVTRHFLAALLRRVDEQVTKEAKRLVDETLVTEREQIETAITERVRERTKTSAGMVTVAEEFEKATGMSIVDLTRSGAASHAARMTAALMKHDIHNPYAGFEYLVRHLRETADRTAAAMLDIGLIPPPQSAHSKPRGRG